MTYLRINEAAAYLGVSADSVRRWISQDKLTATQDATGRQVVSGADVAALAQAAAEGRSNIPGELSYSARNKLTGLVIKINADKVMSMVELKCGTFRIVLMIFIVSVQVLCLSVSCYVLS